MSVYPKMPRLSVRDSFDEDDLSDVDDEVFIRDGKNGKFKLDDDGGVKRPLMAPRKKRPFRSSDVHRLPARTLIVPLCYGLLALVVLLGLIVLCILTASLPFRLPIKLLKNWFDTDTVVGNNQINSSEIVACTSLASKLVWTKSLPKLTSEAPLRAADVNGDGIEDIIVGFGTGLDAIDAPEYFCTLYFGGQVPCLGGLMALDGKTGDTIWTHWTEHTVFSVDCGWDLTNDKIQDCILSGRGGILHAVSGRDGTIVWEVVYQDTSDAEQQKLLDIYDARYIPDVDGDKITDVIAAHTLQIAEARSSEIIIVSGKTGAVVRNVPLPENEQLYVAPQLLVQPDGENIFILVTSSSDNSGGLYIISHASLLNKNLKLRQLHDDAGKGVLLPPVLADITSDGTEDIISAMLNSTVIAYNGLTFKQIWNYSIPGSEVISTPIPGYYNNDNVPDFMVKHQIGLGFPVYYYTVATVLDGKTGKPLLEKQMVDSLSGEMSGLSLTVDGFGNDWFLHWSADCLQHEAAKEKYQFLKGQSIISETHADLCKLRFNSTLTTKLLALSQHVGPPGLPLYYSENWKALEFNNSIDPREEAESYMDSHPGFSKTKPATATSDRPSSKTYDQKPSNYQQRNDNADNLPPKNTYYPQNANYQRPDLPESQMKPDNAYYPHKDVNAKYDSQMGPYGMYKPRKSFDERYNVKFDGLNQNGNWRENNNGKWDQEINRDYDSYDPSELDAAQMNVVREQRSRNKLANQLYLDMDYTNGKQKNENYSPKSMRKHDLTKHFEDNLEHSQEELAAMLKNEKYRLSQTNGDPVENLRAKRSVKRDIQGVQRSSPTGVLVPSVNKKSGQNSVDLVFSTFWLPASETPVVLVQKDLDCINKKEEKAGSKFRYKSRDDIVRECLRQRGIGNRDFEEASDRENVNIALGQMTIYRMKLECVCPEDILPGQQCKQISQKQSWPSYLGASGNGYFKPIHKTNH